MDPPREEEVERTMQSFMNAYDLAREAMLDATGANGRHLDACEAIKGVLRVAQNLMKAGDDLLARFLDLAHARSHAERDEAMEHLRPYLKLGASVPGEVLILIWDWKGGGIVGEEASVGHVAAAVRSADGPWVIVQSQFPRGPGPNSRISGPNALIAQPQWLKGEMQNRRPSQAFLVTLPQMGAFAKATSENLFKPMWSAVPTNHRETNCTVALFASLRAGGLPPGPLGPVLPYDLAVYLDRVAKGGPGRGYSAVSRKDLINSFAWED